MVLVEILQRFREKEFERLSPDSKTSKEALAHHTSNGEPMEVMTTIDLPCAGPPTLESRETIYAPDLRRRVIAGDSKGRGLSHRWLLSPEMPL